MAPPSTTRRLLRKPKLLLYGLMLVFAVILLGWFSFVISTGDDDGREEYHRRHSMRTAATSSGTHEIRTIDGAVTTTTPKSYSRRGPSSFSKIRRRSQQVGDTNDIAVTDHTEAPKASPPESPLTQRKTMIQPVPSSSPSRPKLTKASRSGDHHGDAHRLPSNTSSAFKFTSGGCPSEKGCLLLDGCFAVTSDDEGVNANNNNDEQQKASVSSSDSPTQPLWKRERAGKSLGQCYRGIKRKDIFLFSSSDKKKATARSTMMDSGPTSISPQYAEALKAGRSLKLESFRRKWNERAFFGKFEDTVKNGTSSSAEGGGGEGDQRELVCSWQTQKPEMLSPRTFDTSVANKTSVNDLSPEEVVRMFKYVTGSHFERYYDWEAKIQPVKEKGSFRAVAGVPAAVDPNLDSMRLNSSSSSTPSSSSSAARDQLFMLHNICMTPSGRLSGYKPRVTSRYKGGTENTAATGFANFAQEVHISNFLENIEEHQEEPRWYIDRPLYIVPMLGEWSYHQGHVMQKSGNMVWNIDSAFPRRERGEDRAAARSDVTTAFVHISTSTVNNFRTGFPHNPACSKIPGKCSFSDYGFKYYTTLATTTHFMTYGTQLDPASSGPDMKDDDGFRAFAKETKLGRETPPETREYLKEVLSNRPVCFKEAAVWQACPYSQCGVPHEGHAWPLYGWRNPITQQKVARRFRECAGLGHLERRKLNPDKLTFLLSFRKKLGRTFHRAAGLADTVQNWIDTKCNCNGKLLIASLDGTFIDFIAIYSQVDVIISPYGSGLLYGFLMPPGSGAIDISFSPASPIAARGLNKNPVRDYGSLMFGNHGHHVALFTGRGVDRYPGFSIDTAPSMVEAALSSVVCGIRATVAGQNIPAYMLGGSSSNSSSNHTTSSFQLSSQPPPPSSWIEEDEEELSWKEWTRLGGATGPPPSVKTESSSSSRSPTGGGGGDSNNSIVSSVPGGREPEHQGLMRRARANAVVANSLKQAAYSRRQRTKDIRPHHLPRYQKGFPAMKESLVEDSDMAQIVSRWAENARFHLALRHKRQKQLLLSKSGGRGARNRKGRDQLQSFKERQAILALDEEDDNEEDKKKIASVKRWEDLGNLTFSNENSTTEKRTDNKRQHQVDEDSPDGKLEGGDSDNIVPIPPQQLHHKDLFTPWNSFQNPVVPLLKMVGDDWQPHLKQCRGYTLGHEPEAEMNYLHDDDGLDTRYFAQRAKEDYLAAAAAASAATASSTTSSGDEDQSSNVVESILSKPGGEGDFQYVTKFIDGLLNVTNSKKAALAMYRARKPFPGKVLLLYSCPFTREEAVEAYARDGRDLRKVFLERVKLDLLFFYKQVNHMKKIMVMLREPCTHVLGEKFGFMGRWLEYDALPWSILAAQDSAGGLAIGFVGGGGGGGDGGKGKEGGRRDNAARGEEEDDGGGAEAAAAAVAAARKKAEQQEELARSGKKRQFTSSDHGIAFCGVLGQHSMQKIFSSSGGLYNPICFGEDLKIVLIVTDDKTSTNNREFIRDNDLCGRKKCSVLTYEVEGGAAMRSWKIWRSDPRI